MLTSLIRTLIIEAAGDPEVLSVPNEMDPSQIDANAVPMASPAPPEDSPMGERKALPAPPALDSGMDLSFSQNIPATIQKTVINKELIIAVLSEMKSSITNYQKKFEGEDMDFRDADIYLTNFINSSIYQLKKLNEFIAGDEAQAGYSEGSSEGSPEAPSPESIPTEGPQ